MSEHPTGRARPARPRSYDAELRPGQAHRSGRAPVAGPAAALATLPRQVPEGDAATRHLHVVPDRAGAAARLRRVRTRWVIAIATAAAVALSLVYLHVVLAQRQFALDRMNTEMQKATATYQQQRLQVARLGSPQEIISTAEGRLGMVQPSKVEYLTPAASSPGSTAVAQQQGTTPQPSAAPAGASGGGAPLGDAGAAVVPPGQAPAGDADWPEIKSELAGRP